MSHCDACRWVGMIHCHDPQNCGGPWDDRARDQARSATTAGRGPKGAEPGPAGTRPDTVALTDAERLDAARYREVRRGQRWSVINGIGDTLRADSLDAAIDASIRAGKEGEAQ